MTEEPTDLQRRVPLIWGSDEGLPTAYATNMVVQHTEHEYVLRFYEAQPPLFLGETPEERMAKLAEAGGVKARCVARVVIAEARLPTFLQVLQENLARVLAAHAEAQAPTEAEAPDAAKEEGKE